ncbi:MAG: hydantoinase/oxoprolinase family protein [Pseudomonadota bacterium]
MLGIDTGGTYTDAVLYDDAAPAPGIIAKAKALTTRHDLSIGIGGALDAILPKASGTIGLVSISTTLATNALVEGQGGRVCLILIGFDDAALTRAGLGQALGSDPVEFLAGGHTPTGDRQAPLDQTGLAAAIDRHAADIDGFAVIAYFGTRDPADEITARDMITQRSSKPVTCGHELAASLNGPKRALTALLNARLIGMIARLIEATEQIIRSRQIDAPLMLVRGDGSLVSAAFARNRPIETILSGPAASLIGAAHLTGGQDAVVSDIGGTTTDIAILRSGRPALSPDGAIVGGHHTMIEAVAMTTHGLGGDSEVGLDETSLTPRLILGPRRVVPISLLAQGNSRLIHQILDEQLNRITPSPLDACFALRSPLADGAAGLSSSDQALLDTIPTEATPLSAILRTRLQHSALRRLVGRGLVIQSGLTPTDAAEILKLHSGWDRDAAEKAAILMARRRDATGSTIAGTASEIAGLIHATLHRRSAEVLLDAALAKDGVEVPGGSLSPLSRSALDGHKGATRINIGLDLPLIGLGASAPTYYPAIAGILGTESIIPEHADVANAIGAVVGQVRIQRQCMIAQPTDGLFRVHSTPEARDFTDLDSAQKFAKETLAVQARDAAHIAGAIEIELAEDWVPVTATIEGQPVFIEGTLCITATGRPRLGEA